MRTINNIAMLFLAFVLKCVFFFYYNKKCFQLISYLLIHYLRYSLSCNMRTKFEYFGSWIRKDLFKIFSFALQFCNFQIELHLPKEIEIRKNNWDVRRARDRLPHNTPKAKVIRQILAKATVNKVATCTSWVGYI